MSFTINGKYINHDRFQNYKFTLINNENWWYRDMRYQEDWFEISNKIYDSLLKNSSKNNDNKYYVNQKNDKYDYVIHCLDDNKFYYVKRKIKKQGILVVFEGLDNSGKSFFSNEIKNNFKKDKVVIIKFPNHDTNTGKEIDKYLKGEKEFNNDTITELFKQNRIEQQLLIKDLLNHEKIVILERYIASGIAYRMLRNSNINNLEIINDLFDDESQNLIKPDIQFNFIRNDDIIINQNIYERYELLKQPQQQQINTIFNNVAKIINDNSKFGYVRYNRIIIDNSIKLKNDNINYIVTTMKFLRKICTSYDIENIKKSCDKVKLKCVQQYKTHIYHTYNFIKIDEVDIEKNNQCKHHIENIFNNNCSSDISDNGNDNDESDVKHRKKLKYNNKRHRN